MALTTHETSVSLGRKKGKEKRYLKSLFLTPRSEAFFSRFSHHTNVPLFVPSILCVCHRVDRPFTFLFRPVRHNVFQIRFFQRSITFRGGTSLGPKSALFSYSRAMPLRVVPSVKHRSTSDSRVSIFLCSRRVTCPGSFRDHVGRLVSFIKCRALIEREREKRREKVTAITKVITTPFPSCPLITKPTCSSPIPCIRR